jgi:phage gp37-like protein
MLALIEDAMIERLKGLQYVRNVESYGGQFDDDTFDVVRVLPAIWVTFAGAGKPEHKSAGKFLTPVTFAVMCAARSVRSERATRHGGPAGEVGVYQMLKDTQPLLTMEDLGLPIDHLRPGAIRTLYNTKLRSSGLAVFAQEWHTKYTYEASDGDAAEVLRVNLQYRLKPGDDNTDASDLVELPR